MGIRWLGVTSVALVLIACGGSENTSATGAGSGGAGATGGGGSGGRPLTPVQANPDRDLVSTKLTVDVSAMSASAQVAFIPAAAGGLTLEIGDLTIDSVMDETGPLEWRDNGATLDVGIPADVGEVTIAYHYASHDNFDGALTSALTFTWPYFCGNLFPCKSAPDDGLAFELTLTGVPQDKMAVYPQQIPADAPSYMLAWALGDYSYKSLGKTAAGTEVGYYGLPGQQATLDAGTQSLRASFEWLEQTLGPYLYGDRAASVAAPWGPGAFGGMEHHPLWHVAVVSLDSEQTHVHEAAHGWFGNGIRIACWEDFVLSEGTVSYLAARALEATAGQAAGEAVWDDYRSQLGPQIAWPDGCKEVDILNDGLFTNAPYAKGALFYKSVEAKVGRAAIDAALSSFYMAGRGQARTMQQMLDHLKSETGYDANACAAAWLKQSSIPASEVCP